jgi:L-threonylcarbamoyladenylate synthase
LSIITTDIKLIADLLRNDEVAAIPTETVYGLAGNIFSELAIKKIYEVKNRPLYNPLIVHIAHKNELSSVVKHIPDDAEKLADKFWPGALTMVLPKQNAIPNIVTSNNDSVAVRVPNHPLTLALLAELDFAIAAPSANPFNYISPTTAQHVQAMLGNSIPAILDGGICTQGIESTIIGFDNNEVLLYRYGSISVQEIEATINKKIRIATKAEKPQAPGMLDKHYSPHTTLIATNNIAATIENYASKKIGLLTLMGSDFMQENIFSIALSHSGNLLEAAHNLYANLHQLDAMKLDVIIAELMPEEGVGMAVNDKLRKASS